MFLITKNATKKTFDVFSAEEDKIDSFINDVTVDPSLMAWKITSPVDFENELSKQDMVDLYNQISNSNLKKFQNKADGASRTYPLLEKQSSELKKGYGKTVQKKASSRKKGKRLKGVINLAPKENVYECREGSKQAALVDALKNGATMQQLIVACSKKNGGAKSWSENSVKSGVYWDVNKIKGYGIRTVVNDKGVATYHLTYPKGVTKPLPHKKRANA